MSLKLYYDPYDINCFRGEPTTNLFTDRYPAPVTYLSFPDTASYRSIWTPNGVQTSSINKYYNNNSANACCPSLFIYQTGLTILPSTTYCYSSYYKVLNNDYGHPNFLYRYEYNGGTYLTEAGVWNASNRIPYPGGWYRIFGTFTTQATANIGNFYSFTYEYNTDNTQFVVNHQLEAKNHLTNYVGPGGTRGVTVATGGGLIDLTGNNNNGDLTYGSYVTSTVFHNNTFYFDGVSANNCIRILDANISSTLLPTGKSFSIVLWVYKLANATNTQTRLFGYTNASNYGISIILYGTSDTSGTFGVILNNADGTVTLSSANGSVNTAGWHMYTMVYSNNGTYKNYLEKYLDGSQLGTRVSSSLSTSVWTKPSTSRGGGIVIGTSSTTVNTGSSALNLKGYIGEVRIYDHALSADEVSTLYKLGIQKHI
jgi:hypothetical protein